MLHEPFSEGPDREERMKQGKRTKLFDDWSDRYDWSVAVTDGFPFAEYERVLEQVVRHADAQPSMAILDIGTGTGNLARPFACLGCRVWGVDSSAKMLRQAGGKLRSATLVEADVLARFLAELHRRFDRIVSAYVFHEFDLVTKVSLLKRLAGDHLAGRGRVVIGDAAFPSTESRKETDHESQRELRKTRSCSCEHGTHSRSIGRHIAMAEVEGMNLEDEFDPSFTGTFHEREWITESLSGFYQDRWFTDVLYRVKGGKEATVYCCEAHPDTGLEYLAAKVFRPRAFRAMKNDWLYKQGRGLRDDLGKAVFDGRSLRAVKRKTRHGRRIETASWCQHEYSALRDLHEAGADVPRPLAIGHNAILMEYIGDATRGAPILHRVSLDPAEARELLDRLIRNVELFLECYRIHADLSAYNVLYWEGRATVIDFPQAVDLHTHPNAFALLSRDIERLCRYFVRQGVPCDPGRITQDLWTRFAGPSSQRKGDWQ